MEKIIITGRILFGINNIYTVEANDSLYECRIKGKILRQSEGLYNPLTAGDHVDIETDSHSARHGVIVSLHERKNVFTRWNRKRMALQLMASNIDLLLCITTPDDPPFRPRFIDRVMLSQEEKYEKVILMNKSDLPVGKGVDERLDDYRRIGIKVLKCSAVTNEGIDELQKMIENRYSAFVGQSGVGKSTIINLLTGKKLQRTGEISQKYSRGRHTTNYSVLIPYGDGAVIDTPGIRDIFIERVEPEKLAEMFIEFRQLAGSCAFNRCSHISEEDCAVKKGVEEKIIHSDRYTSYVKLYREITELSEEVYGKSYY